MEIILKDGVKFLPHHFETEGQFERIVFAQCKSIFGENAILFDKQKIRTETGIGTIPDAFVILPDKRKWYIIEVELASHSVYVHMIPQITRFKNALDNVQTRRTLTKYFDKAIEDDLSKLANWVSATNDKSVHRLLTEILEQEPELLIIIDDVNKELEIAAKNLPFSTKINIFKTFCREGFGLGDNIFQFETLAGTKAIKANAEVRPARSIEVPEASGPRLDKRAQSPSASEWVQKIPELKDLQGLRSWASLCNYHKINHQGSSARRVFKTWVTKERPDWVPVPEA